MTGFDEDFRRLTGKHDTDPFPWQRRVWECLRAGSVPRAVDVPTGLGKTSVLASWLLAHLHRASDAAAALPRRLVYVVDRRAVVDQASRDAETLAANWKKVSRVETPPLRLATLRGQHIDSGAWLDAPGDLSIIVGTVDMIGSRLLFSGYGVSPGMRPVHAGLLGVDTLLVLDEAHLTPAFADLITDVAADGSSATSQLAGDRHPPTAPFQTMLLSATQRTSRHDDAAQPRPVIRLDAADRDDVTVRQRLSARKAIELRSGAKPEDVVETVKDLVQTDRRIVVFLDSRRTAEKVAGALAKEVGRDAVLTFTGGRRAWERQKAETELQDDGFLAGAEREESARILVATSAAEVGVDLDADDAVMDLVAWERMVQRLGRVNRFGLREARIIVCDGGEKESRGASLDTCRDLLSRLESASPAAVSELVAEQPELVARASTPAPLRPPMSRADLDAWSLTGVADHPGRAAVAPFLRGWVEDEPQVRLAWRNHLPTRNDRDVSRDDVSAFFEAAPVHLSEILEVEIGLFKDWLKKRVTAWRPEAAETGERAAALILLDRHMQATEVLTLDALRERMRRPSNQVDSFLSKLTAGTVVLRADIGGLTERGTLDASVPGPAVAADDESADAGAPSWAATVGFRIAEETKVEATIDTGEDAPEPETKGPVLFSFPLADEGEVETVPSLVVRAYGPSRRDTSADARSRGRAVTLTDHTAHVRRHAAAIAGSLGLSETDRALLDLAAELHDAGKAARHWQSAMNAPQEGRPWAKTRGGDGRKLEGYRHEFGSVLTAQDDPRLAELSGDDRDLVLHLVASHHGHARPFLSAHGGDVGPPSAMAAEARDAALRFARLSRLWGPWGVAWWEAVFRAADRAASKAEQERRDG